MEKEKKEGMSVRELEGYAKRHRSEIFFCLLYVLASLFTMIYWGAAISILLAGLGGILGALLHQKVETYSNKVFGFLAKQEKSTEVIVAIALLVIAIFVAPLVFLATGLHGGRSLAMYSSGRPQV